MNLDNLDTELDEFAAGGDFQKDWALAQRRQQRSFARTLAPALAAAAVIALVAWTALPFGTATDPGAGLATPDEDVQAPDVAPVDDGIRRIGRGQMWVYVPPGKVKSISVVLPEMIEVFPLGGGALQLHGKQYGRTDISVVFEDHAPQLLELEVVAENTSSHSTTQVARGTFEVLDLKEPPTAISIVSPEVLDIQTTGNPSQVILSGKHYGVTDVLVQWDRRWQVYTVEVGVDPGPPLASTPIAMEMQRGSARHLPVEPGLISISSAAPEVLEITTLDEGHVRFGAQHYGRSDVLLRYPDRQVHYRIEVVP